MLSELLYTEHVVSCWDFCSQYILLIVSHGFQHLNQITKPGVNIAVQISSSVCLSGASSSPLNNISLHTLHIVPSAWPVADFEPLWRVAVKESCTRLNVAKTKILPGCCMCACERCRLINVSYWFYLGISSRDGSLTLVELVYCSALGMFACCVGLSLGLLYNLNISIGYFFCWLLIPVSCCFSQILLVADVQ